MNAPGLFLRVGLAPGGAATALEICRRVTSMLEVPADARVSLDDSTVPGSLATLLPSALDDVDLVCVDWSTAAGNLQILFGPDFPELWSLSVSVRWAVDATETDARALLALFEACMTAVAAEPTTRSAGLERMGALGRAPDHWFGAASWVVVRRDTADGYASEAAFLEGWSSVEPCPRGLLLKRGTGALLDTEFRQATEAHSWALARIADPGRYTVWLSDLSVQEDAVHRQGPPRMQRVGYLPGERTVEYSALLGPSEHLQGWEICDAADLLGAETEDGPIEAVRVVFLDEAQARQEASPLLNLGIQVFFMGPTAQLEALT